LPRAIALSAAACWLLSAAQVLEALSHPTHGSELVLLGLLSVAGLASCAAWLASWRYARAALAGVAALYLVFYCVRTWTIQVEPRMAFTDASLLEATLDSLRIVQATIAHSLSVGNLMLGAGELFYEWLMPLTQIGVLAWVIAASRRAA
jgi:hypothetical protein